MSGSLFFNRGQHNRTILALFVQCWFVSSFTVCGTTMNRGRLWMEHERSEYRGLTINSNTPFCFEHIECLIPSVWGLVCHCWSLILKNISVFVFEYSFRNEKCYYLLFYSFLVGFLMSNCDIRKHNGSYLSCYYASRSIKFTTFIDESVKELNRFPAHSRDLKS